MMAFFYNQRVLDRLTNRGSGITAEQYMEWADQLPPLSFDEAGLARMPGDGGADNCEGAGPGGGGSGAVHTGPVCTSVWPLRGSPLGVPSGANKLLIP